MRQLCLLVSGGVVAAHGWGSWWGFLIAWGCLMAMLVMRPQAPWWERGAYLLLALAAVLSPPLTLSSSILSAALLAAGHPWIASGILLAHVPFLLTPWVALPHELLHPAAALVLYGVGAVGGVWDKVPRHGYLAAPLAYAIALAAQLAVSYELNPVPDPAAPAGYAIGAGIEQLTGRQFPATGTLDYEHHPSDTTRAQHTLYLDHGSTSPYAGKEYIQPRPWGAQIPLAAEPLAMAIKRDGVWICNIGISLHPRLVRFLGGHMQGGRLITLLGCRGRQLISGDSDFAVDCLAPYQKHLIRHLTGTDTPYRLLTLLSAAVLALCTLRALPPAPLLPALTALLIGSLPENGDIRYIGTRHAWPHTDLGEGLVRHLRQHGRPAIFGTRGARILVVGQGRKALWQGERVIILEPEARITLNGKNYSAGAIPLGPQNGIADARSIPELPDAKGRAQVDGIPIIATGSPCLLTPELLWPPESSSPSSPSSASSGAASTPPSTKPTAPPQPPSSSSAASAP